jgi:hypothetical protein
LKKRLDTFNELVSQNGFGKDLRFDIDNCENLIRFMDAVVIKLEDGSNEDIELMMQEPIFDEAIDEVKKKLAPNTNGLVSFFKININFDFLVIENRTATAS